MAVTVKIDLGYEFEVKAKADEVFAVLSDVPTSVSHFPKVEKLTDMGDGQRPELHPWRQRRASVQRRCGLRHRQGRQSDGRGPVPVLLLYVDGLPAAALAAARRRKA